MQTPLAVSEENHSAVSTSEKPENHVRHINPDGIVHPRRARAIRVLNLAIHDGGLPVQIDCREAAEGSDPEDEEDEIPEPEDVALDDGRDIDHDRDGGCACDNHGIDPRGVRMDVCLCSGVKIHAVEAGDGDCKHELQEADEDAGPGEVLATWAVVLSCDFSVHAEAGGQVAFGTVELLLMGSTETDLLFTISGGLRCFQGFVLRWEVCVDVGAFGRCLWWRW